MIRVSKEEEGTRAAVTVMDMYLHDSATVFRFVLRGEFRGDRVEELEHAWTTARSILGTKELVVDISGITKTDAAGEELLSRMRESGARLKAAVPAESAGRVQALGNPILAFWHAAKRAFRLRRGEFSHRGQLRGAEIIREER